MKGKLLLILSTLSLAACGGASGGNANYYNNNNNGYTGVSDLSAPKDSFDYGGVKKEDVIEYLKKNNMGGSGQATVYEYSGDMQLSFYYVANGDAFNVVNKTVATSGGATQTTLSGITFKWGNIYKGDFVCSITFVNGSSNYQGTVQYTVFDDAFLDCPNMGSYYSAKVNYGTFPTQLRSNVDKIVSTQWLGIKVAVAFGEKICKRIKDGCHLWGSEMQTNFEKGSLDEKNKLIRYFTNGDDYGDIRVGHRTKSKTDGSVHFWYDPADDYFTVETYTYSSADRDFQIITLWRFRFGSFIRGDQQHYAENSEFDFDTGMTYKNIYFRDNIVVLRSDHSYRLNEPVFHSSDDPSWDATYASKFKDDIKNAATEMMSFLDSEWNAAGMSFKLW